MEFRRKRKKILSVKKKESEVRIILYGFRAETHKIVTDFNRFFAANPALSCRVLVLNFSDARVADLDGDNNDVDYIVIKCNKAKTLKKIEIALSCDAELKKHLIDFQSVVFTSSF